MVNRLSEKPYPKLDKLEPEYVHFMPEIPEHGKLYISKEFGSVQHLCACGCGSKVHTPLNPSPVPMWDLIEKDGLVSLSPSIGNYQIPCKTHYVIRDNEVIWL
jgi:hypothetical protein